ncbi:hypothetical protein BC332_33143 [Capsicum chinense]|nr:hypothetical protein BC332_33143 [Capsicum chinense]
MELFGATTITRKIILEGGHVAVDDDSRIGSGSGATVGANDAPLTVFETTSHFDYDNNGCTGCSKCSACKCQDYESYVAIDGSSIRNYRTALIYLFEFVPTDNPSDVDVIEEVTAEEHNITVDNPSTASKEEEKVKTVNLGERKNDPFKGYCQQQPEVYQNEECLINIIKGFSIPTGLPWHLVNEVYITINCGDEFHWVLFVVILKERHIRVYDPMSRKRHFGPSSEIQKMAKILPNYLDMSGFLDLNVCIDWSTIEAHRDKMANPFDVQYVEGISQQTISSLNCGPLVAAYAKYLSDRLQVPNDGLDARLLRKIYAALLWKYGEAKTLKPYTSEIKDPRRPKSNSVASDEEQLVYID